MNMANVFPPFKIDIAGAFCVPRALKDVREQYQNGQVRKCAVWWNGWSWEA